MHTDIVEVNRNASNIEKEFIPSVRRLKFCLRSATASREDQRIIVHSMLFHRKKHISFVLSEIGRCHKCDLTTDPDATSLRNLIYKLSLQKW